MSINDTASNIIDNLCEKHCPQAECCNTYCETALVLRKAIEYPLIDAMLEMEGNPYPDEMEG